MEHKPDVAPSSNVQLFKDQIKKRKSQQFISNILKNGSVQDSGQFQFQLNDVTAEYDANLMGRLGSREFSQMFKSNAIVGGILSAYKNLILSCNWTLDEIVDATPEEQKIYNVLYDWFFDNNNFDTLLNSILGMLPLGFSCFNKFYVPYNYENNVYMMPTLLERIQQSIYRIDYEEKIVEQITSSGSIVTIPFADLVFFTFRQEGEDLRGTSLLRQAYYDYKDQKEIKQTTKKGLTRNMLGLPIGKVPAHVKNDSPEYTAFAELLELMASREYTDTDDSIILPDGYDLDVWKSDFKINEVKDFMAYYDSLIAVSVLAQFILLGQIGKGGSFSLGADQSDFFLDGLHFIVKYIEKQFTKEVIKPAIKTNWENIDVSKFRLRGLNLDKKASQEFANIIQTLMNSGILKIQKSDEKQIREMYGLSEIDESERQEAEEREQKQIAPPTQEDDDQEDETEVPAEEIEDDESMNKVFELKQPNIIEFWSTPKQRNSYIDQQVSSLTKYSKASLQIISEKLLAAIQWQLKQGNNAAQGLKDVKLNKNAVVLYKKTLGIKVSTIAKKAWDNAKKKSAPHLERIAKSEMATPPNKLPTKTLTAFIVNQVDLSTDKQVNELRDISLLVANTATSKGYSIDQTVAAVEESMDNFIDAANKAELTNSTTISQAMALGEMEFYKSIENNLWGYRYQNDAPITALCQSLVGKVYHVGSAEMSLISPPNHYRCKSYFEPIYADEQKPEYDDYIPPSSILKQKTM